MRSKRSSSENITTIPSRDIQGQRPLTSPSEESTGGQDSRTIFRNMSKDVLPASKTSLTSKRRSHPYFPSNQSKEPTPLRRSQWIGLLNSPLLLDLIPSSPSPITIVLKRSYSYHVRKLWGPKILPRSTTRRSSPTLGSHPKLSPIEISDSPRNWHKISALSWASNRILALLTTPKQMGNPRGPIKPLKLIYESSAMNNRPIGHDGSHSCSMPLTRGHLTPPRSPHSNYLLG